MKFKDKLKQERRKLKLTHESLAKELGVTARTMSNYENGKSYPKDRNIYIKLADFFKVEVNYFLTEDEEFLTAATELYGKKGQDQAREILAQTAALFAGGELSEQDQLAFQLDMQALFFESKEIARKKYTPKKYAQNNKEG